MLARIRKSLHAKDEGFTLIELLVVMIIIGILAAIAIPVFLNQRKKAQDSATKADVSTLGKEIATYWVDGAATPPTIALTGGRYLVAGVDAGAISTNVAAQSILTTGWTVQAWCVALTNSQGSGATPAARSWKYSAQNGLQSGNCTSPILP